MALYNVASIGHGQYLSHLTSRFSIMLTFTIDTQFKNANKPTLGGWIGQCFELVRAGLTVCGLDE